MKRSVSQKINTCVSNILETMGYRISRTREEGDFPRDMDKDFIDIHKRCAPFTGTEIVRQYALYKAVEYIIRSEVPGDLVECGVWRGGSVMIMAHLLLKMKETGRKLYLYDTFAGMARPSPEDSSLYERLPASETWKGYQGKDYNEWCFSPLDEVRRNVLSTGYPEENVIFVKGRVEETLPITRPPRIALLRLDTDWFESTYCEMKYLFPLLSDRGVIIIDDYGYWAGARKAVDRYIAENGVSILLNRIDHTGRIGVKTERQAGPSEC